MFDCGEPRAGSNSIAFARARGFPLVVMTEAQGLQLLMIARTLVVFVGLGVGVLLFMCYKSGRSGS